MTLKMYITGKILGNICLKAIRDTFASMQSAVRKGTE